MPENMAEISVLNREALTEILKRYSPGGRRVKCYNSLMNLRLKGTPGNRCGFLLMRVNVLSHKC